MGYVGAGTQATGRKRCGSLGSVGVGMRMLYPPILAAHPVSIARTALHTFPHNVLRTTCAPDLISPPCSSLATPPPPHPHWPRGSHLDPSGLMPMASPISAWSQPSHPLWPCSYHLTHTGCVAHTSDLIPITSFVPCSALQTGKWPTYQTPHPHLPRPCCILVSLVFTTSPTAPRPTHPSCQRQTAALRSC